MTCFPLFTPKSRWKESDRSNVISLATFTLECFFFFRSVFPLQITHTFSDYGPGLRLISFEHGGQDTKFWDGWFGVRVTGSSVIIDAWTRGKRLTGERKRESGVTEWLQTDRVECRFWGPALPYALGLHLCLWCTTLFMLWKHTAAMETVVAFHGGMSALLTSTIIILKILLATQSLIRIN